MDENNRRIYKYHFYKVIQFIERKKEKVEQMKTFRKIMPNMLDFSSGLYYLAESFVSHIETITKYEIETIVEDLLRCNNISYVRFAKDRQELESHAPLVIAKRSNEKMVGYAFDIGERRRILERLFLDGSFENMDELRIVRFIESKYDTNNKWRDYNRIQYNEKTDILRDISFNEFFTEWFGEEEYKVFKEELDAFRGEAIEAIGFDTVLKPTEDNVIAIILEAEKEIVEKNYEDIFKNKLPKKDVEKLEKQYIQQGYYKAMLGNKPFADSFIASEWMLKVNDISGSLDYTGVVSGYLKSVEQLLKSLIETFEGKMLYYDNPYDNTDAYFTVGKNEETNVMLKSLGNLIDVVKNNKKLFVENDNVKYHVERYLRAWCEKRNPAFHSKGVNKESVTVIREEALCIYFLLLGGIKLTPIQREKLGGFQKKETKEDYQEDKLLKWLEYMPLRRVPDGVRSLRFTIIGTTPVDNNRWTVRVMGFESLSRGATYNNVIDRLSEKGLYDSGDYLNDGYSWIEEASYEAIEARIEKVIKQYLSRSDYFEKFDEIVISSLLGNRIIN